MEILVFASLLSAFLAGLAALFAPCCIGVLLPTYFASIFRQKRTVLLMTLVFFFGLLAVFLPLGLGFGFLGEVFKAYHNTIYLVGGLFLFFLGASILLGVHWSMPLSARPQGKVTGVKSVFILGIFSGFATLCCAPVLAGALALSLLPGSVLWGGLYAAVYVLGMVFPLFVISYFVDKSNVLERMNIFKKELRYYLFKKQVTLTVSNLVSGIVFVLMSVLLLYYLATDKLAMQSSMQTSVNIMTAKAADFLISLKLLYWMILPIVLLGGIILWRIKRRKQ